MAATNEQVQSDLKHLNTFLKDELAAVETYGQYINHAKSPDLSSSLNSLKDSHQKRAEMLIERIRALGGAPAESAGLWGNVAKLTQSGSNLFGEKSAVANLEEGEDRGRDHYQESLNQLSPDIQRFVKDELLPEQLRSHDAMHAIEEHVKQLH